MKDPLRPVGSGVVCNVILVGHAAIAGVWWWVMPEGFGVGHPRFWTNEVLPWVVIGAAVAGRFWARAPALAGLAAMWVAGAISARMVFPVTFGMLWLGASIVGGILGCAWALEWRRDEGRLSSLLICLVIGSMLGGVFPKLQKVAEAGTKPMNAVLAVREAETGIVDEGAIRLTDSVVVASNDGEMTVATGGGVLAVRPLLTFQSRSPDGCWTAFASTAAREGPGRRLVGVRHNGARVKFSYRDDDRSVLSVDATEGPRMVRLEAVSRIPGVVWSHLNTFAELQVTGRGPLEVVFSPCAGKAVEIRPKDYPIGRPARFAYVDAGGIFRVVEAKSAEKGPFRELASGALAEDAPLAMEFRDDGKPLFRVVLADWVKQASRQLSPTAGWGVPENAIEFSLDESGSANVFVTLAGTSVGRGFDSVGYTAGVYRNGMTVEWLGE